MWMKPARQTACGPHSRRQLLANGRHRSLARLSIAVRRFASLAFLDRPHPRPALQSNGHQKDAADDAVFEHVVVLLIPANGRALEDQRLGHQSSSRLSSRATSL